MITATGQFALSFVRECGAFAIFTARTCWSLVGLRALGAKILRAAFEIGVRCLPITLLVGVFTGLVLGLQGYHTLSRFGSEAMLGAVVAVSLVRELGPVLTALMVAGQAGSALAAEIGIQRNSEQIDALDTMGVNPLGFLVGSRLVAGLLVFPLLTALFDLVGMFGGYLTGVVLLSLEPGVYANSIYDGVTSDDVRGGFYKALAFGFLVVMISAFEGYYTHRKASLPGARGVSQSTTRAVVFASVVIVAADYVITSFLI